MKTYIITRFSILDYDHKQYRLTRNEKNFHQYKEKLFSKERMEEKFNTFEKITLPSVINQTNQNYLWEIYASEYMSNEYKNRLLNITKNYHNIKIYFIKSFKEFNKTEITCHQYCTLRLDDDDALNPTFIEKLQKYKNQNNSIISFPRGQKITIKNNEIIYGDKTNIKKIAIGLCGIGMNIYNCGDHTKVDQKYNIIYDNTPNMYLIYCSKNTDTSREFTNNIEEFTNNTNFCINSHEYVLTSFFLTLSLYFVIKLYIKK